MTKGRKSLQFRPFQATDSVLLGAWLEACGLGVPKGVADQTWARRMLTDPNIGCWAACEAGQVVGFLRLDTGPDRSAEVTLIVHPQFRRRGFGQQIVEQALREARSKGLRRLLAVLESGNHVAHNFFQNIGFEEDGGIRNGHLRMSRLVHRADQQPPLEISP
jgi:ribosomal protein S18 acetylase RimI-like enzyme